MWGKGLGVGLVSFLAFMGWVVFGVFFNLSYIPVESLDIKKCIYYIFTCNKRSVLFFPILYI